MQKKSYTWRDMESELRHSTPKLREANPMRVDAVCARMAAEPPAHASARSPALGKHLARAAACMALAFSLALYLRLTSSPATHSAELADLPAEVASVWSSVKAAPDLDAQLTTEVENLTSDFDKLTIAINNRALALLF